MKPINLIFAALLSCGLAGCEPPAEQDEPEQVEPDTEATMESAPETQPTDVETSAPESREVETTTQEAGEAEETSESEEAEEPPPDQA